MGTVSFDPEKDKPPVGPSWTRGLIRIGVENLSSNIDLKGIQHGIDSVCCGSFTFHEGIIQWHEYNHISKTTNCLNRNGFYWLYTQQRCDVVKGTCKEDFSGSS